MAFNRTITITGLDEVLKNLAAYGERVKPAAAEALALEANEIKQDSQVNYVPVDQSTLQGKAYVKDASIEGDTVSVELGYEGPYAAAIHENPRAGKTGGWPPDGGPGNEHWVTIRDAKYPEGHPVLIGAQRKSWATTGGWKYLELPLMAAEKGMLSRIADRMRGALGGK